jgi:hypothetical protein
MKLLNRAVCGFALSFIDLESTERVSPLPLVYGCWHGIGS